MSLYSVPKLRLPLSLGSYFSPGYFGVQSGSPEVASSPDRVFSVCFTMPILGQADSLRRLVMLYDDSDVNSYSYPCSTVLDGIPGQAPSYRLSTPLHPFDGHSPRWGKRFTLAPRGQEFHLHEVSVIQDRFASLLSFCLGFHP